MEQVVLVNQADQVIGHTDLLSAHLGNGQLHRAISVLVFNSKKELLLQKRSKLKPLWSLYWSNTCCGNKRPGSTMHQFAKDRLGFEMGINTQIKFWYKFAYQSRYNKKLSEYEIDYVYLGISDQKPKLNKKEAADYKYLSLSSVKKDIKQNPNKYTPWFKLIMKRLKTSDILSS